MQSKNWLFPGLTLLLVALTAGFLAYWRSIQKLGQPGIAVKEIDESGILQIQFPEAVSDYTAENVDVEQGVIEALPADTTIDIRYYHAPDGFRVQVIGVLMGTDRTSIHQPQFCLTGAGFTIAETIPSTVKLEGEQSYELPITILKAQKEVEGQMYSGFYAYWFVADGLATAEHWERMWWMAKGLFQTGELQRWAYISCFAPCVPEYEEQALERLVEFMQGAIPKFQPAPANLLEGGATQSAGAETARVDTAVVPRL